MIHNSNSILDRNSIKGFKRGEANTITLQSLPSHPWEDQQITPYRLVALLFWLHNRKDWIPPRPFKTYLREAKNLIQWIGEDESERLMIEAYDVANHPWGINFLYNLIENDEDEKVNLMGIMI